MPRRARVQQQHTLRDLRQPVRLDRALRTLHPEWGRRAVQTTISAGNVFVNGRKVWLSSWQVQNGDRIEIKKPPPAKEAPPTAFNEGWLLHTDEHLVVVNKPAGLLSHAPRWRQSANLLDLAIARFGPLSLFHRLDRDTSGVVVLTRTAAANRWLDHLFKERLVAKEYVAVVTVPNQLAAHGTISARIGSHPKRRDMMAITQRGGKHAITRYRLLTHKDNCQLVKLWPETGRTHQLRVHLDYMDATILGDRLYGKQEKRATRLMLHAQSIMLPAWQNMPAHTFAAPLPPEFNRASDKVTP